MQIKLDTDEFRACLSKADPTLTTEQLANVVKVLVLEGLGLDVLPGPEGFTADLGHLKLVALDRKGNDASRSSGPDPLYASDFRIEGWPNPQNVTAVSVSFDASSMEPLCVKMRILPLLFPEICFNGEADTQV